MPQVRRKIFLFSIVLFMTGSLLAANYSAADSVLLRKKATLEQRATLVMSKYHGTKNLAYAHVLCEQGMLYSQPNTVIYNEKKAKDRFRQASKIASQVGPESDICADILYKTIKFYQNTDRASEALAWADHLYELTYHSLDSLLRSGRRDSLAMLDYLPRIEVLLYEYASCNIKNTRLMNLYNLILLKKNFYDFRRKRGNNYFYSWRDVRRNLSENEYAVDYIAINHADTVAYTAVALGWDWSCPQKYFVELPDSLITAAAMNKVLTSRDIRYYRLMLEPLLKKVKSRDKVYFSLDSKLNHLAFENMKYYAEGKVYLCDMYELHRVNSTLLPFADKTVTPSVADTACLFGYADFGDGITWMRLKGTALELNDIYTSLKQNGFTVEAWRGTDCSEQRIRDLSGRKISVLHIATHGYYVPNLPTKTGSGIALAGANNTWDKDNISEDKIDGILTAAEIENLDLSSVQLVVLSACRTSLGSTEDEEVSVLLNALRRTGAKCVILSNWNVNDEATRTLMSSFYKNWATGKMSMARALQEARKEVRQGTYQYSNGKTIKGNGSDPVFWGAFTLYE